MVRHAQETKPAIQRTADVVVGWFVPAVLVVAAAALVGWIWAGDWRTGLSAFTAVLVVACPCALGLATPTAVVTASGRGAENGIFFKDAAALEVAARITTVIFDKTGTLTEGRPRVSEVVPAPGIAADDVLSAAAAVQRHSSHPLSRAVVEAAERRRLNLPTIERSETVAGRGAAGYDGTRSLLVGNERFLSERGVDASLLSAAADHARESGGTPLFTAVDGRLLGFIVAADRVAPSSVQAVEALKRAGLRTMLVSGDHRGTVAAAARAVGIDRFEAEVVPAEKHAVVTSLQRDGEQVAMVGDGINDAPALAAAELGIAVGHGADVAVEAADVVLARRDLRSVAQALALGRVAMRVIRQNLVWALGYNVVLIPLAAGAAAPWFGADVRLPPSFAAAAMALSSLSVVLNSLTLRFRDLGVASTVPVDQTGAPPHDGAS